MFAQKIEYKIDKPSKLFVGTPFHLYVDIFSAPEDSIFTSKIDTLDIFILKGDIVESQEIINEEKITHLDLTFQPFDTGEFTFPELEFSVKTDNGLKTLKTSEFILNVISIVSDSTQTIKDIAEPLRLNFSFGDYFIVLLIIAIIIGLILFLKKILKKKEKNSEPEIVTDNRPAYEIALELLDNLEKEKLLENGNFLQYHFRLSYILRFFIEKYYMINAVEMTTSEIRDNLQTTDFTEKSEIMKFLSSADLIKFAKFIPELEKSRKDTRWLRKYLFGFNKKSKQDAIKQSTGEREKEENE